MSYNTIKWNDTANCPGVGVSVFFQGCPHHCKGCFNQETWDFDKGIEWNLYVEALIFQKLSENGIHRDLNILGGEPLCNENLQDVSNLVTFIHCFSPETKIYLWTGYTLEQLKEREEWPQIKYILEMIYCLIDGPFIKEQRDITLPLRGSTNQRVIYIKDIEL